MRVVVSLTTLPGREALVQRTLHSMQRQTLCPDRVYVWLAEGRDYSTIPTCEGLELSVAHTLDQGPATKLVPTLACESEPDTIIVTVDDDVAYPPRLLEKLVDAASLFPNCAIGFTGWQVAASEGQPVVHHFNQEMPYCGFFHPVDVLEGTRGVLYRRGFFADDVGGLLASCDAFRYHDDIFFAGYLAHRGISRLVRWFDHLDAPADSRWEIACQDSGLHMTQDWHRLGRQCWDYWGDAFAPAGAEALTETAAPRLRISGDQVEDGFLLSGHALDGRQPGQPLNVTPKPAAALPWADGRFSELIVDARVTDWKGIVGLTRELLRISAADAVISMATSAAPASDLVFSRMDALGAAGGVEELLRRACASPGVCAVIPSAPGVRMVATDDASGLTILIVKGGRIAELRAPRPDVIMSTDPKATSALP